MTRFVVPGLCLALGLITAAVLATAVLTTPKGAIILGGFSYPVFRPEHLLALVVVGLWAGWIGGTELWALPLSLLAGMASGFALCAPGSIGVIEPFIQLAILISTACLVVAVLSSLCPSLDDAAGALILLGVCHGSLVRLAAGSAEAPLFGMGALMAGATLLALGVSVGQAAR